MMSNFDERNRQRTERIKKKSDESFDNFLSKPLTRMAIAGMPAGEQQDALRLLLRASFDEGVSCGQAEFAFDMLEALMKKDLDKRA